METNTNSWYRLTTTDDPQRSIIGTFPYMNDDTGMVSVTQSDSNSSSQQWQLFPVGSSEYMLRTKASGAQGYLTVKNGNGTCEEIIPVISTQNDGLVVWTLRDRRDAAGVLGVEVGGYGCTLDIGDGGDVRLTADVSRSRPLAFVKIGTIDDPAYSAVATPPVTRVQENLFATTTVSTILSTSVSVSTNISTSPLPPSTPSSHPLQLPASHGTHKLSTTAAMGIGVAVGIISVLILLCITMLLYRRRKLRRSQHFRHAKQWKGFEPATPSTAHMSKMAGVGFKDLPTPVTPAFLMSPPLENGESGSRWGSGNRMSWRDGPVASPDTPGSPPAEMPGK